MYSFLSPTKFFDYELLDSGNFEKLERFGDYVVARPEPQAIWNKSLPEKEWLKMRDAVFNREVKNASKDSEKGNWHYEKKLNSWKVSCPLGNQKISFLLQPTSFKHVGIFPEQASNWDFIYHTIKRIGAPMKVLNLFAYTGGASLAAKAAGADVVHVDAVKPVVNWSRQNMEESGLQDIRWVVEDAFKFVQREAKRGNKYQGIILDPPAYGRGPKGEKWVLEEKLNSLLHICSQILDTKNSFGVLNLYSMGFSPLVAETLVKTNFSKITEIESGELFLEDKFKKKLPLGVFSRFIRSAMKSM